MRISHRLTIACAAMFAMAVPGLANAAALSVVNVNSPAVNCVFHTSCTVVVNDSVGNFTPPGDTGTARLQSRTYPGTSPAPAAGLMAYVYRVDLTAVKGATAANCVSKLAVDFGPDVKLPYSPKGSFDVFVVTSGGLGSVGLSSATLTGATITFNFGGSGVCPGATSYFFGLASKSTSPKAGTAKLLYSVPSLPGTAADRVP